MSRKHLIAAAAAMALAGLTAGAANAAAFQNGGFEAGAFVSDGAGADSVGVGTLPGWSLAGVGDVSWDQDGAFSLTASTLGSHFLDLTGYCDTSCDGGGYGGVSQTFDTVAHAQYTVTFELGSRYNYANAGSGVVVSAAGFSDSNYVNLAPQNGDTTWDSETFTFTAQGASTTLSFVGNKGAQFVGLDNVAITQDTRGGGGGSVPEPASWALMIIGFGGAGMALRGRRKGVLAAA